MLSEEVATNAVADLYEFRDLEDGWDGPGSLAPTEQVITNALQLIDIWYWKRPEVTPNNNGTVSFEWSGAHLEVGLTTFSLYNETAFINGTIELRESLHR